MTQPSALRLWLVDYTTEDGDSCSTVVQAHCPEEAFEIFRTVRMGLTPEDFENYFDREAFVYKLEPAPRGPGVVEMHGDGGHLYALNHDCLEMQAVRAVLEAEHDGH